MTSFHLIYVCFHWDCMCNQILVRHILSIRPTRATCVTYTVDFNITIFCVEHFTCVGRTHNILKAQLFSSHFADNI